MKRPVMRIMTERLKNYAENRERKGKKEWIVNIMK